MKRDTLFGMETAAVREAVVERSRPSLRAKDVELWRASLDDAPEEFISSLTPLLSGDEEDRASKFFFERDRRRFVVGRGILRLLLGRYLNRPAAAIELTYGPNGKPELAAGSGAPLQFNLAHSEGLALFAFTGDGAIGVDVERIRELPDWEHIAASCFSPAERILVESAPADLKPVEFFRAWTRQEARLKATGQGFGDAVPCGSTGFLNGTTENHNPAFRVPPRSALHVYSLQVAAGYAGALAAPADARWITCFSWDHQAGRPQLRAPRRTRRIRLQPSADAGIGFL